MRRPRRPLIFAGSSEEDLAALPREVKRSVGDALDFAQRGRKHESAKPLKGFGGAGVLEIGEDYPTDTYRAVYTVRFREAVYVLHVFQKKSPSGRGTPRKEIELVQARLHAAEADYAKREEALRAARIAAEEKAEKAKAEEEK